MANLIEELFPQGGVIDIGEDKEGGSRYVVMDVLKENEIRTLEISLYFGSDPEVEAKLKEYLPNHNYKSAANTLNRSNFSMTMFYDSRTNGLRKPEINDYLKIRTKKGIVTTLRANELSYLFKDATNIYETILKKIKPILEGKSKRK